MSYLSWVSIVKQVRKYSLTGLVMLLTAAIASGPIAATADTKPLSGTPATVSADALPTVQIDGIVWAQTIVNTTVYATGNFSTARPAGVALGGAGSVSRSNLLAYDITTGNLLPFNHTLNGEGRSIAVSPDHTKLYVGGAFTTVDGLTHPHIAEFNLSTTGTLVNTFTGGTNDTVKALTASNTVVYAGGIFNQANGVSRNHLVAFMAGGNLTGWVPTTNAQVEALLLTADTSKVIIGGPFNQLNGITYHGMGAVSPNSPGNALPWASQNDTFPIRDEDPAHSAASITSFSTNGSLIFLTAFNFMSTGGFEGRAALSPKDGSLIWLNDCHGDTYSSVPIGSVLYSVGHAHDCQPAGAFPETTPRSWHRALAETLTPSGVNGPATDGHVSFAGLPRSSQLDWYPDLSVGSASGANQAAWSITGTSDYIALGGEFPTVNGKGQQGLVRFAVSDSRKLTPNKVGPQPFGSSAILAHTVGTAGKAAIRLTPTWDPDNGNLTYALYRDGGSTPIHTYAQDSRFWSMPVHQFEDSGLVPGSSHTYKLTAADPFGNLSSTGWIANTYHSKLPNDWDGDGRSDAATFTKTTGSILWYVNQSSDSTAVSYGIPSDAIVPGDYNGDGVADIAVYRPSTQQWFVRGKAGVTFGATGAIPVPGDYTGDGVTDFAYFLPSDGTWHVQGMATIQFGQNGDIPIPGDYNGDGKADVAVYHPGSHKLLINGGPSLSYGTSADIPVPADYNGDAVTDFGMWAPANGNWYISTNLQYTTITPFVYGASGDIPVPGDYNGDGQADAAYFVPSNKSYAIRTIATSTKYGAAPAGLPYAVGHAYFPKLY